MKRFFIAMLLGACVMSAEASSKAEVESGIAGVERMIENHQWQGAFAKLYEIDASIGAGNEALHYLVAKQRFRMYARINRNAEVKDCMEKMEALALKSNNAATIEDMLIIKAGYNNRLGNTKVAKDSYKMILDRRSKGMNDDAKEACFKKLISEASANNNGAMRAVISDLYAAWQDSIASVKAGKELTELKGKYNVALEDIDSKATKIGVQWGVIIFLAIALIVVGLALAFFILMMVRNKMLIKRLQKSLEVSEINSAQKSVFMRNITKQISPSLNEIAHGNGKAHVTALTDLLNDVEGYMVLDETKENDYEVADANVGKLCEEIVAENSNKVMITTDAPKMSFPVNSEAVKKVLNSIIDESLLSKPESIALGFKKRNPHTGHFTVTIIGMILPEEEREILFTAFAKVYNLTETTGLVYPTCALLAHKMGGNLSLDSDFTKKGTRFILEVHG